MEKAFSDWFNGIEGYGLRCERFYADASIPDSFSRDVALSKWLYQAFLIGYEARKNENSISE